MKFTTTISFILILACVPALCAGWGRVSYDHGFGAPTCGLKKFVTKEKMSTASFEPWTSGLIARCANSMVVWAVVLQECR